MEPPVPPRPALPRGLVRRIDRLASRAHRFHRWAHHPLCREYEAEVFRVGRKVRLCRGCTLAALGGAAGLLVGGSAPALVAQSLIALGLPGLILGFLALRRRRLPKLFTRALPVALLAFLAAQAPRGPGLLRWVPALLALGTAALVIAAYRRRGPDRTPCAGCPEAALGGTCRGYREIRTRERALQRKIRPWLAVR